MIDKQGGPAAPPGRKRPGPTIDLKATEVTEPAAQGTDPRAAAGSPSRKPDAERSADTVPPREQSDPPSGTSYGWRVWPDGWGAWPALSWRPASSWRLVAAAAAGAAVVLLVVLIARSFGGRNDDIVALEGRLAQIEQEVRDLADRPPPPAPPAVDPKVIEGLSGRVTALEAAVRAQRPPAADPALTNRMSTLEGALKALDEKVGVTARRTDDIDSIARDARQRLERTEAALAELAQKVARLPAQPLTPGDLSALTGRIASLERTTAAIQAELGKDLSGEAADRDARISIEAAALNAALDRGESFAGEFAALQALGADPKALAALSPYAASGVPSATSLGRELLALIPALDKAGTTSPRDGSFLARLAAGAGGLVRVRPVGDVKGDDPAAILARIEQRAAQSDIAGALAELAKLTADARAPAQAWIDKAQARSAALAASRELAADALAALAKPPKAR